jgi:hypothetical protein
MRHRPILRSALISIALSIDVNGAQATDIYVNIQTGRDGNPGTKEQPLAVANRALRMAQPGDTIHLLPPGAVYRESLNLTNKSGLVIEGNGCTISGADPLPADPAAWEAVSEDLHRRQVRANSENRYILVKDGKGQRMGRNKFRREPLDAQFPALDRLRPGEFRVEPIAGERSAWLYIKGSLDNLEWAVRQQGVMTGGRVRNITLRNLKAKHALNDGFNLHADAQNIMLIDVEGSENYDNGISPHGACSMTVEDGSFRDNGTPDWAQGDATQTDYRRCVAGGSGHQWEVVFAGGVHRVEDSTIHLNGNELWFVKWPIRAFALNEIRLAGKDPEVKPEYTVVRTQILGDPEKKGIVNIGAGVTLTLEECTFTNVTFDIDPAATVRITGGTADGKPLASVVQGK